MLAAGTIRVGWRHQNLCVSFTRNWKATKSEHRQVSQIKAAFFL